MMLQQPSKLSRRHSFLTFRMPKPNHCWDPGEPSNPL